MRQPKTFISIVILLVIGLHAVPVVFFQGQRQTRWPFLAWAMYKNSIPPGPIQARKTRLLGITAKGQTEEVTARAVGLSTPAVGRLYLQPMLTGDSAAAQRLILRLNRDRPDPFVELRLESETHRVTPAGIVKEERPALSFRVDAVGSR